MSASSWMGLKTEVSAEDGPINKQGSLLVKQGVPSPPCVFEYA